LLAHVLLLGLELGATVKRRCFPVGASPTRQPLQPEAPGAVMEVTKWLTPSDSVSRYTVIPFTLARGATSDL
jgi:hypothetical protein